MKIVERKIFMDLVLKNVDLCGLYYSRKTCENNGYCNHELFRNIHQSVRGEKSR